MRHEKSTIMKKELRHEALATIMGCEDDMNSLENMLLVPCRAEDAEIAAIPNSAVPWEPPDNWYVRYYLLERCWWAQGAKHAPGKDYRAAYHYEVAQALANGQGFTLEHFERLVTP